MGKWHYAQHEKKDGKWVPVERGGRYKDVNLTDLYLQKQAYAFPQQPKWPGKASSKPRKGAMLEKLRQRKLDRGILSKLKKLIKR